MRYGKIISRVNFRSPTIKPNYIREFYENNLQVFINCHIVPNKP